MIPRYKKQSNIAAGIWLCTFLVALVAPPAILGGVFTTALLLIGGGAFWFALWAYIKAKGHSGLFFLLLPLLVMVPVLTTILGDVIGAAICVVIVMAVLIALRDKIR